MAVIEYVTPSTKPTVERPIKIFLNDAPVAVSQGSPYGLEELAIGYLLSEGLLSDRERLGQVTADADRAEVFVASGEMLADGYVPLRRVTSGGSARSKILQDKNRNSARPALVSSQTFSADDLVRQMEELCERSPKRNTGECVHGCGLGDSGSRSLLLVREDIGRHNAMDKLIGQAWLDRLSVGDKALFITGRISCEMGLKAYKCGCPVLVSRKSATDEAVAQAEKLGITLVSHCRNGRLRVLCCPQRIIA